MAFYAKHCPTQRFSLMEWNEMPILPPRSDEFPPYGYSRALDDAGKAVVVCWPEDDGVNGIYCVRPILVVSAEVHR